MGKIMLMEVPGLMVATSAVVMQAEWPAYSWAVTVLCQALTEVAAQNVTTREPAFIKISQASSTGVVRSGCISVWSANVWWVTLCMICQDWINIYASFHDLHFLIICYPSMGRLIAGLKIVLPSLVIIRYGRQEPAVLLVLVRTPAETPEKTLPVSMVASFTKKETLGN